MTRLHLEQMLKQHEFILSDHACLGKADSWYSEGVYHALEFGELNSDLIRDALISFGTYLCWVRNPQVVTTPKVIAELDRFYCIIDRKARLLNKTQKLSYKSGTRVKKSDRLKVVKREDLPEECVADPAISEFNKGHFRRLGLTIYQIIKTYEAKKFTPSDQGLFNRLEMVVRMVAEKAQSKRCYDERHGSQRYRRGEDLHADEELVAAALYRSLFECKPTCLFSEDSDLGRLLCAVQLHITDRYFPEHEFAARQLTEYPVKFFFDDGTDLAILKLDTSDTSQGTFQADYYKNYMVDLEFLAAIHKKLAIHQNV